MDKISRAKVVLTEYKASSEITLATYNVEHNNGNTSLEQNMTIKSYGVGVFSDPRWKAEIALDDFPDCKTVSEAALKLSDWLGRLSKAILVGDYNLPLHSAEFVDTEEVEQIKGLTEGGCVNEKTNSLGFT